MSLINRARRQEKFLCFRQYYKFILFLSLTLYFFASCFVGHEEENEKQQQHVPLSSIQLVSNPRKLSLASRALIESTNRETATFIDQQSKEPFNGLKIFIYELPSKYNSDWLANEQCSNHLFAAEVAIHTALLSSDVRTLDPYAADFFFVPVYVTCNFSTVNGFPAIGHARSLISDAVRTISGQYPFWNRTRGSDHVFVATHDFGACFHTMEDRAIADGIPEFMRNSIILQTFGVVHKHPCKEAEHVVIPPYVSPESVRKTVESLPARGERDIWVFFRGKMEINPKNISGRFYSKRVRTEIWRKYAGDRRFFLHRKRFAGYQSEIARSVFCLCPLGWAPWSPRLVESAVLGCVPVVIADGIRLPFPSAVRWPEISLTVPEADVGRLGEILGHVASTNLTVIQRNLADPMVRRALLYHVPMKPDDATWQILDALSRNFDRRSHRKETRQ